LETSSVTKILCKFQKYDCVTLSADRLWNTSFSLIGRISLQTLRTTYIGYLELQLKMGDNVKSVIV